MNEDLLGFLLNVDERADHARLEERMGGDAELAKRVELVRLLVSPLAVDRDTIEPPADLVTRTIARVAEHLGRQPLETAPSEPLLADLMTRMDSGKWQNVAVMLDRANAPSRGRMANWVVAASVGVLVLGLLLAGLPYLRYRQNVQSCQNQLRQIYGALETYADTHGGGYPQVGEKPPFQTAGSFLAILRDAGAAPGSGVYACPSAEPTYPSGYAYTLGYRDEAGNLLGLRHRLNADDDSMALAADRPPPQRTGTNLDHRYGQNVLFVGGNVRFCTHSGVGPDGDDIYRNQKGLVAAGLNRSDSVLGVGSDRP